MLCRVYFDILVSKIILDYRLDTSNEKPYILSKSFIQIIVKLMHYKRIR